MKSNNQIILKYKTKIYPLSAIYTAAYIFLDKAYIYLDKGSKDEVLVVLKGKEELSDKEKNILAGEFNNELLNCVLRENIAKENTKIREYIVGQALYSSVQDIVLPEEGSAALADPLGIAVPWEEKYGDKKKLKNKVKKVVKVK